MPEGVSRPKAYAVWHPDDAIRMASSSGGAFSLMAEQILKRGGVVFGAAWVDGLRVKIVPVERLDDLGMFRGSKYVSSDAAESYKIVPGMLERGRLVLYSGAPCQIAGLKAALKGRSYPNLITVDFICHGMPERKVFEKYIRFLESRYGDRIDRVFFRDKAFGVECNLLLKVALRNGDVRRITGRDNTYYHGFIHNIINREICAKCCYNFLPRQADISLCDYRGLGEHVAFVHEADKVKGFTGVMVNSGQGKAFLDSLPQATIVERPFDELANSQCCLRTHNASAPEATDFRADFERMTWKELSEKYLTPPMRYLGYIWARRILGPALFLRLGIFYKRLRGLRTTSWWV